MKSREQIYDLLKELLVGMFEVEPANINPNANLYEDLDVDSIDAVDLIVELRKVTGKQIDPDVFKAVRTVDDVVNAIVDIIEAE
jgi:acyl carrier protein